MQRQFFNHFLNNSSEHKFFKSKGKVSHIICSINDGVEHAIISRHISSKSMVVLEVVSILPQMENVIHDIRGIAIHKFIHFGQQPVNALLVNCLAFHLM